MVLCFKLGLHVYAHVLLCATAYVFAHCINLLSVPVVQVVAVVEPVASVDGKKAVISSSYTKLVISEWFLYSVESFLDLNIIPCNRLYIILTYAWVLKCMPCINVRLRKPAVTLGSDCNYFMKMLPSSLYHGCDLQSIAKRSLFRLFGHKGHLCQFQ